MATSNITETNHLFIPVAAWEAANGKIPAIELKVRGSECRVTLDSAALLQFSKIINAVWMTAPTKMNPNHLPMRKACGIASAVIERKYGLTGR